MSIDLSGGVTTIAVCWRVARSDGVVLGFTTHDALLEVDGLAYAAAPGMTPSAIGHGDGIEVDTMEIGGALTADAITDADLAAGRYDGAEVRVIMVDWADPRGGTLSLARGTLGAVDRQRDATGGGFTAAVRGPAAAFDATAIETCSPDCRAELGDRRCRVDLAPRTTIAGVGAGSTRDRILVGSASGDHVGGRVRALDGPNAGIDARIAAVEDGVLILFEPLPFVVAAGSRLGLREGCDKRLATCVARFGNAINFRGEPHVPGGDLLTRFPGV